MNGRIRSRRSKSLLIATAATLLLCVGVASAGATPSIEGIWSFQNGAIGVQRLPNGNYEGIVVKEVTFDSCPHKVEEPIWTNITEQSGSNGLYTGGHQWFHGSCARDNTPGPTAWRVITEPDGSYYLRVCFSSPGSNQQPTIAANGDPREPSENAEYHVTYGCYSSQLISLLPSAPGETPHNPGSSGGSTTGKNGVSGIKESLELPGAKQCLSGRLFKIHLPNPKYDPFKSVAITLKGHKIKTSRKGNYVVATINLRGLRKGAFTININATTVLGHHLTATRTYHTCVKKKVKHPRGKKG
jgi:hypothetical protein